MNSEYATGPRTDAEPRTDLGLWRPDPGLTQSALIDSNGLTAAARLAGRYDASTAMTNNATVVAANVGRSSGSVSNSRVPRNRVRPAAPARPSTRPMPASTTPLLTTDRMSRDGDAPSARRTPISRVRKVTAYDSTP